MTPRRITVTTIDGFKVTARRLGIYHRFSMMEHQAGDVRGKLTVQKGFRRAYVVGNLSKYNLTDQVWNELRHRYDGTLVNRIALSVAIQNAVEKITPPR